VFFFFSFFNAFCAFVYLYYRPYHIVVKAVSIDRYSCLSGSLSLLFLNTCAILCVCSEANKYSQSVYDPQHVRATRDLDNPTH